MPKKETVSEFYSRRLREQREWMISCGDTLAGYIKHYTELGRSAHEAEAIYRADHDYLERSIRAFSVLSNDSITVSGALTETRDFIESLGYRTGDVHDNLVRAISHVQHTAVGRMLLKP